MVNHSMDNLTTIIYYTSNQEEEAFESKVRERLIKNSGGLPIISVSHKPIDLGTNICVGVHTPNDHNLYRQIQIACKAASTPFVISAEADCIYPPEYFQYTPEKLDKFYRYSNIWILYKRFNYYFQKSSSECSMMAGREFYVEQIDKMLANRPEWDETPKVKLPDMSPLHGWDTFYGENPAISFKTSRGLRTFTRTLSNWSEIDTLPYWGDVNNLKKEFNL